jgi:hypothetical protein
MERRERLSEDSNVRIPLAACLAGLTLALVHAPAHADGAPPAGKIENPWKVLPAGTVLEFKTTFDESFGGPWKDRPKTHKEGSELWTVIANDGKTATIEIASDGAKKQEKRDLSPVDPPQQPTPDGSSGPIGSPDGQEHTSASYDKVTTPFGTFDCIRIDRGTINLEWESHGAEWLVAGIPEPVKWSRTSSGGNGATRSQTESRTLVRFEVPGETWHDYPPGTSFDVEVVKEHRNLHPPGQAPTTEKALESWTLMKKDEKTATFAVAVGGGKSEKTVPLALGPVPENGTRTGGGEEHTETAVAREAIETQFGKLDCWRISRHQSMNEAGGVEEEWRARGFPIAVKTHHEWGWKQQQETETRTIVRFARAK